MDDASTIYSHRGWLNLRTLRANITLVCVHSKFINFQHHPHSSTSCNFTTFAFPWRVFYVTSDGVNGIAIAGRCPSLKCSLYNVNLSRSHTVLVYMPVHRFKTGNKCVQLLQAWTFSHKYTNIVNIFVWSIHKIDLIDRYIVYITEKFIIGKSCKIFYNTRMILRESNKLLS